MRKKHNFGTNFNEKKKEDDRNSFEPSEYPKRWKENVLIKVDRLKQLKEGFLEAKKKKRERKNAFDENASETISL